jgi:hypothetical protein
MFKRWGDKDQALKHFIVFFGGYKIQVILDIILKPDILIPVFSGQGLS